MFKGIFWLKSDELISVKVLCNENGNELEPCTFSSKSGKNFNHKIEWDRLPRSVTCGSKYDYYPRGRMEIGKGKINAIGETVRIEKQIKPIYNFKSSDKFRKRR